MYLWNWLWDGMLQPPIIRHGVSGAVRRHTYIAVDVIDRFPTFIECKWTAIINDCYATVRASEDICLAVDCMWFVQQNCVLPILLLLLLVYFYFNAFSHFTSQCKINDWFRGLAITVDFNSERAENSQNANMFVVLSSKPPRIRNSYVEQFFCLPLACLNFMFNFLYFPKKKTKKTKSILISNNEQQKRDYYI